MSQTCYHCGQAIESTVKFDEKEFCCNGCQSVYQILNSHALNDFYALNPKNGVKPNTDKLEQFDYLDAPAVFDKLVDFSEGNSTLVNFKIPVMHCSSCIWLMESLNTINPHIKYSNVNFTQKTVQISFNHHELSLSGLAKFLTQLGYQPVINLESAEQKHEWTDRSQLIRVAVAFFCFGNAMLFSYVEYFEIFGGGDDWLDHYRNLFRYICFLLAIPVVSYCSLNYYKAAWFGLKNKRLVMDVPIVLGIFVLFGRSFYEVFWQVGAGYFDTLCGLLFFMSLGKLFQQKTFDNLSYDRDYKSFYPIAVTKIEFDKQENILLSDLKVGDRILVRNEEIIPVDAVLIKGEGNIDNSFITGEAETVAKVPGDKIFAGGKQKGAILELEVIKDVNQSYLTQLWNKEAFKKKDQGIDTLTNYISQYFTIIILIITAISAFYWRNDSSTMYQVICAILIVACPCALALSAPFTLGHIMRILGKNQMYVKDSYCIEKMAKIDHIVFDKTGTITYHSQNNIHYQGQNISDVDKENLSALLQNSNHPLSRSLYQYLDLKGIYHEISQFAEVSGQGIAANIRGTQYQLGSATYLKQAKQDFETAVYIGINGQFVGKFIFQNMYREGIKQMFDELTNYHLHLLSGDNASEQQNLQKMTSRLETLAFNQSPEDKLNYIQQLQQKGHQVAMLGDGLNDAGALKQSQLGIAIADDSNSFTPASDVILHANQLQKLHEFFWLSKKAIRIVKYTYAISLLYNVVGLAYAVTGQMDPLVAAIIMPASSISVMVFTSISTWFHSRNLFKSPGGGTD